MENFAYLKVINNSNILKDNRKIEFMQNCVTKIRDTDISLMRISDTVYIVTPDKMLKIDNNGLINTFENLKVKDMELSNLDLELDLHSSTRLNVETSLKVINTDVNIKQHSKQIALFKLGGNLTKRLDNLLIEDLNIRSGFGKFYGFIDFYAAYIKNLVLKDLTINDKLDFFTFLTDIKKIGNLLIDNIDAGTTPDSRLVFWANEIGEVVVKNMDEINVTLLSSVEHAKSVYMPSVKRLNVPLMASSNVDSLYIPNIKVSDIISNMTDRDVHINTLHAMLDIHPDELDNEVKKNRINIEMVIDTSSGGKLHEIGNKIQNRFKEIKVYDN